MKKAEASSYFAVEILYEGIFGHVITFWIFTYAIIVLIVTAANIPITISTCLFYLKGKSV